MRTTRRAYPPFGDVGPPDEWEYTTAGRIACDSCGEAIYTRRRRGTNDPHAFPAECQVCGAPGGLVVRERSGNPGLVSERD